MYNLPESYPFTPLLQALRGAQSVDLQGLTLTQLAWLTLQLGQRLKRPIAVIVAGEEEADKLAEDLRFFVGDAQAVTHVPAVEAHPYHELSPDRGAVRDFLSAQARLVWGQGGDLFVLQAQTLARRVVPKAVLSALSYLVSESEPLDREACLRSLAAGGYQAVSRVEDPGTFAVRGAVLDVFPPHLDGPVRIELWGDEVESIRSFDAGTQRSGEARHELLVLPPVREEILVSPFKERAQQAMLTAAAEVGVPSQRLQDALTDLRNGLPFVGIEGFRPGFYEALEPFDDLLPPETLLILCDPLAITEQILAWTQSLDEGYAHSQESAQPALAPAAHSLSPAELTQRLARYTTVRAHTLYAQGAALNDEAIAALDAQLASELGDDVLRFSLPGNRDLQHMLQQRRRDRDGLSVLREALREWVGRAQARVMIVCYKKRQQEALLGKLKGWGLRVSLCEDPAATLATHREPGDAQIFLARGRLEAGFRLLSEGWVILTEAEIFGEKTPRKGRAAKAQEARPSLQNLRELAPGDHVVHLEHGVGLYEGLRKIIVQGVEADFLTVSFAGEDRLFVPVYQIGVLQKYVGSPQPKIDKLGGTGWSKVYARARKQAEEDALALLSLYAERERAQGFAFSPLDEYDRSFEASFPFTETVDQARAISDVLRDMQRERPMDRLLCGDVGFGKTEVAMRAAFKAVSDGKQVAVLVPTTVLALQHAKTFQERFAQHAVEIALVSRLGTKEGRVQAVEGIRTGRVQIAIGTHRLLSKDIEFSDLGLLILDEEHRFGVQAKEHIKSLRAHVDILSMTATPIPRTLQLSLSGIRDLSTIMTPPTDRLSVKTIVCRATDHVLRQAIMRELSRGGQVFVVHNRVSSLANYQAWLTAIVPEARIIAGHGQMSPEALERVMLAFTKGEYNVLLSTTIIESGIDIPNANTILVSDAGRYGLAQLYQLRGRVGRGKARGYCYLMTSVENLGPMAKQRLAVIQRFTELGSGFQVASSDMELRGAGELLGKKQKGHVQAVGIDMYAQLIEEAVQALRGGPVAQHFDPDIKLHASARLSEAYVPDDHLRLMLYNRLANAASEAVVCDIEEELEDRFGELPPEGLNLIEAMRIRALAKRCGLAVVELLGDRLQLKVDPRTPLPIDGIIALVGDVRSGFSASEAYRLDYQLSPLARQHALRSACEALQRLARLVPEPEVEPDDGDGEREAV